MRSQREELKGHKAEEGFRGKNEVKLVAKAASTQHPAPRIQIKTSEWYSHSIKTINLDLLKESLYLKKTQTMRNLIIILALLFTITACNKDKSSNNHGIVIKGKIQGNIKGSETKGTSLSLADATTVFAVNLSNGGLNSEYISIKDGSFDVTAEIGTATSLIFFDASTKYIGTLSTRGLNLLPLNSLENGENTTIDLASLTLSGTTITASHDPFGNEIKITDAEVNRLKELDGFFESLAKNLDADNNGILDASVGKQLFVKTRFSVKAKHFGVNTAPQISDIDMNSRGYTIELDGGSGFSKPTSIVMTGPVGSPYDGINTAFINSNGDGGFYAGITRGGLFKKGTYSINIDGYNCSLEYSNNEMENRVLVLPTLHTNSEGKLVSVSLEYKLADGTSIDPVNMLTDVMLQFFNDQGAQYFDSPRLKNEGTSVEHCSNCIFGVYSYTPDTPMDISNLDRIAIGYDDLLGNSYNVDWSK